jgi:hypothetical protein
MHKFALIGLLTSCLSAFAWGPEGHALVARIAETELTPATQARVLEILGPGSTMTSVASWADDIRNSHRETGRWHYIDIPINKPHLDMDRDCPEGDCVIAKIEQFRDVLKDPATPPEKRREALMFVVHFVGDMHQPLHSSNNGDHGGNDVRIVFHGRAGELHSLWDSGLLNHVGDPDALFARFSREARRHEKQWAKGTVRDWAEQSHKVAQKMVYGKLPKTSPPAAAAAGSVAGAAPITITAAYEQKADLVIARQIEEAGVRLASLLNATLQ